MEHSPVGGGTVFRRIVLLGFMGSGKTSVGKALADALGWDFADLDAEIEGSTGQTVAEIFAGAGEPRFRSLEVELTPRFLSRDQIVLAPGGGWVTNVGLLEGLPPDTLTVWLRVSPAEVLRRVSRQERAPVRPLLDSGDRAERVEALMTSRETFYRRAAVTVDTDGRSIQDIVQELIRILGSAPSGESNS